MNNIIFNHEQKLRVLYNRLFFYTLFLLFYLIVSCISTTAQSNYVFEPEFHFQGDTNLVIHQIIDDGSGGYYAQGFITDTANRTDNNVITGIIMRLKCDGSPLWFRSISNSFDGSNSIVDYKNYHYNKVIGASNGDVIVLDNFHDFSIARFTNQGVLDVAKRVFYGTDTTYHLLDVKELSNGSIILTGYIRLNNDSRKSKYPFILCLDSRLNTKWGSTNLGQKLSLGQIESVKALMVFDDKIYLIIENREESIGIQCLDFNGRTIFYKNYPTFSVFRNAAIYNSSTDLILVNRRRGINGVAGLRMRILDPHTGDVKVEKAIYNHMIIPINGVDVAQGFVEPPAVSFKQSNEIWQFLGYENRTTFQIYNFGNPFYMEFDDSLNLKRALRYGTPYDHPNVDSIVSEGMIDMHDDHWNMPFTRRKLGNNYFSVLKRAGVLLTDKDFSDISCVGYMDLTDSMRYFIPRFKKVRKPVEIKGSGPRIAAHTLSGKFLYPQWKYNC